MARLPQKVKESITEDKIFTVATSSRDGLPNVIYIKYLKVLDDETILIADNKFDKTLKNIKNNPRIAFALRDDNAGSYQVKGSVEYLTSGPHYEDVRKWCREDLARKGAVVLHVDEVFNGAKKLQDEKF